MLMDRTMMAKASGLPCRHLKHENSLKGLAMTSKCCEPSESYQKLLHRLKTVRAEVGRGLDQDRAPPANPWTTSTSGPRLFTRRPRSISLRKTHLRILRRYSRRYMVPVGSFDISCTSHL